MFKKVVAIFTTMVLLIALTVVSCAENTNYIFNGSFELLIDGEPSNWMREAYDKSPGASNFRVETEGAKFGEKYVTIINNKLNDSRYSQIVLVEENKKYKLSCYIKTENVSEEGKGANLSVAEQTVTSKRIKGTTDDWEYVELYVITSLARAMVSGVDVWLNTPRRPQEASGTSGMKAAINGVLNLSIYDGWWVEGYNGKNGWVVGDESLEPEHEENDQRDSESLYNILETQIIPTYYENRTKWLSMMRESIKSIVPRFSTHRMVKEYMDKTYVKAFINSERLSKNDFENAKRDVNWESRVVEAWNGVSVKNVAVEENGASLRVTVNLGQLSPEDVKVELFLGREGTELEKVRTVELRRYVSEGDSTFTYFYTDGFLRHLGNPQLHLSSYTSYSERLLLNATNTKR